MRKKFWLMKCFGVLMTAMLLFSMFGCSDNSTQQTTIQTSAQTTQTTKTTQTTQTTESGPEMVGNMYVTGLPILKEKQTFKVTSVRSSMSAMDMKDKEGPKLAEAETNVVIEWDEVPDSGWTEKVNLLFATGDLPDAFFGGVDVMRNKDLLAPINDLIDAYAPNVLEMFSREPDVKAALTTPDGKIYSLPAGDANSLNVIADALWANMDWLDSMDLEIPETTDAFYDVLKAFKTGDPNGNGQADEIPLLASASAPGLATMLNSMFGSFGTLDTASYVRVENGQVIFTPSEPGYLNALRWFNKLYTEGLLNQEYFTESQDQLIAKNSGDISVAGFALAWHADVIMPADRAASYKVIKPLKGPEGDQLWIRNPGPIGSMSAVAITTSCENPEVLVRYYDYIHSSLEIVNLWGFGPDGTSWRQFEDGTWEIYNTAVPEGQNYAQYRRTVGTVSVVAYCYSKWTDPSVQVFTGRTKDKADAVELYMPFTPAENFVNGFADLENLNQRNLLLTDIGNYMKRFKAEAIMSETGLSDAQWQTHMDTLESLKVEEYVSLWQEFYDSKK